MNHQKNKLDNFLLKFLLNESTGKSNFKKIQSTMSSDLNHLLF